MARRLVRTGLIGLGVYLAVAVAAQVVTFVAVGVARLTAGDPRSDEVGGVANFRMADEKVWFGGQPEEEAYAELARQGVTTIVDLRTGADDDERQADPDELRTLGVDYRSIPVPDGHAPARADVRALLDVIDGAPGVVFVHCGGGVGRSTTMQAAYLAASGQEPGVGELLAVGPMTAEQAWVVAAGRAGSPGSSNVVVRRVSEALDAPRRALSRIRALP